MSLFGSKAGGTGATADTVANGIDVQTSLAGTPIQIVYGCNRVSGNLIWYGGFQAIQGTSNAGKGGATRNGQYDYRTSFIIGVAQGPVINIERVWASNATSETLASAGLTLYTGGIGQPAWPYVQALTPGESLGYSGLAYVCAYNFDLGSSASLPNFNFEVAGILAGSNAPQLFDASPALVISDVLTNPYYGLGFPAPYLGDLTNYHNYCQAQGLWISPVIDQSEDAASQLEQIATGTNAAFVWSGGQLNIVPYGDLPLSNNGAAYTPPQQPLVSLTDDDFIYADNEDPVTIDRSRPADQINALSLEYLNRLNAYNPDLVQARDEGSIAAWGLQTQTPASAHYFCDGNAAQMSAQLQLNRQAVRNNYTFKLGWKYCWLDPMDIVAINDAALGLSQQWVRILSVDESEWSAADGGVLTIKAEEYLYGTGQAPLYSLEQGRGFQPNYNAPAPASYAPVFIEPTFQLTAGALEIWMAVAGPAGTWSGADVWISQDGTNYAKSASVTQSARYGYVYTGLDSSQPGLDLADSFGVDLTLSQGALAVSPGLAAAETNTSLCYVDGEFLSYGATVLTGALHYQISTLNRGQFGTAPLAHAAETLFVRCDNALVQLVVQPGLIGRTLYVKLLNRNAYGAGQPSLSEVEPYAYTFQGRAYTEPFPAVTGFGTVYADNFETLVWTPVDDPRTPGYEIRLGINWGAALVIGQVLDSGFAISSPGTYWIAARYVAPTGYVVYGPPTSISVQGAAIIRNLLVSFSEGANGWTGACQGTVAVAGNLQLDAAGNILGDPALLAEASVLNYGGWRLAGTYTSSVTVNAQSVLDAQISIAYAATAQSIYDNTFTVANVLADSDLLENANGPVVTLMPQIAVAQADGTFAAWQNFTPAHYLGQYFRFRLLLATSDPTINCVVTNFTVTTDVPDRAASGTNYAVSAGGATIVYTAPFNVAPNVQVTILGGEAGDVAHINKTATGFTVTILNNGAGVARTIDWIAQGY